MISDHSENASLRLTTLSEDNYQEKLGTLVRAKEIPMSRWKAGHVLSWLEIEVNMPMYGKYCAENIKSGKVSVVQRIDHVQFRFELYQLVRFQL